MNAGGESGARGPGAQGSEREPGAPGHAPPEAEPAPNHLVAVCGGRNYEDDIRIIEVLKMFLHPNDIVVHGTCRGADVRAGHHARRMGHKIIEVAPDWVRKGRSAALIRNRQIVDMKPRMLIAFPGGKGTAHAKKLAVKAGIPVIEIVGKPDEPIDVKGLFGDE